MIEFYIEENKLKRFVEIYKNIDEDVCACGNNTPGYCDNHSFTSMFHYLFENEMMIQKIPLKYKSQVLIRVKEYLGDVMESGNIENSLRLDTTYIANNSVNNIKIKKENITALEKIDVLNKISLLNERLNLYLDFKIKNKIEELLDSI